MKKIDFGNKLNISSRHLFYYVCGIGVAVTILMYMFPFREIIEKTRTLSNENEALRQKITLWKEYDANKDIYLEDTAKMLDEIDRLYDTYPLDAKEEDVVMLAVNLTKDTAIDISNINMTTQNMIYEIPKEEVLPLEMEEFVSGLTWNEKQATYVVTGDYDTIKNGIERIYQEKNNIAINGITLSKDEAGLVGNIDVSFYSLMGTSKNYEKPDITKYINGTQNIFGISYEEND